MGHFQLTGLCRDCQEQETVQRVLVACTKYQTGRKVRMEGLMRAGMTGTNVKAILGSSGSE